MAKNGFKTVVIIPAYNEERNIRSVIKEAKKYVDELIVVDDGSTDNTAEAAKSEGAFVIILAENKGVGFATRAGVNKAINGFGAKRIVLIDADGQHPADRIPLLLSKLDEGFDIVFTARRFNGEMPLLKRIGNIFLTFATNLISGVNISDSQSGFKAFTADAWNKMAPKHDGYEFCSEIVFKAGRARLNWCEVPIKTIYNKGKGSTGTRFADGIRIFLQMVRFLMD